jgi:transposase
MGRSHLDYILPLRRNSKLIPRVSERFEGVFTYHKRPIKFWVTGCRGRRIYIYEDILHKSEEEKDFLQLISEGKKGRKEFHKRKEKFGKIYLLSTLDTNAEEVYLMFKQKENIEYSFNILKNLLEADKLYTRTDEKLFGYIFLNFISLYVYYKALNKIAEARLQKRFSLNDILLQLSKVKIYLCEDTEILSEIPAKVKDISEKLNLNLLLKKGVS